MGNDDAVGRYRDQERAKQIDASGVYNPRFGDKVEFAGPAELASYLVGSEDAHRAFVRRAFQALCEATRSCLTDWTHWIN